MKRIRQDNKVKIEHYKARNEENELQYKNLLAVCDGNESLATNGSNVNPKRFTCDTMKKEQEYPEYVGILRWYVKRQIRKHA